MLVENGELRQLRTWVIMILIALVGGGGGNFIMNRIEPPRADPFTGTQAIALENRLATRMSSMEEQHQALFNMSVDMATQDSSTLAEVRSMEKRLDKVEVKLDRVYGWAEPAYRGKGK